MDPITAVGVAGNIVQLVAVALHVSKRIKDFSSSHFELPEALRDVAAKSDLLNDILGRIKREIEHQPDAFSDATLRSLNEVMAGTRDRAQRLAKILDQIAPAQDDPSLTKTKKALLSIGKDGELSGIAEKLTQDAIFLTLHQVTPAARCLDKTATVSSHLQNRTFYEFPYGRVQEFIGREDALSELKHTLTADSDIQPRIAVLQGMGGQGKTQIALEYCRRARKNRIYSAIFWADASSEQSLRKSFEGISEHLRAPGEALVDTEARVSCVKAILSEWSRPWLLVFDNYDNVEDFPLLAIAKYIPSAENCAVLFTSRTPHAHRLGRLIHVSGMPEEEAVNLLLRRVSLEQNPGNVSQVQNIVRRLGYLPLAIDQAGAYLRDRQGILPLDKFLDHYEKHADDILTSTPGIWEYFDRSVETQEHTAKTVFTTWNMSLNLLKLDTETGQKKAALLDVLAFFDEKDISEELFSVYCDTVTSSEVRPSFLDLFTDASHKWQSKKFEDVLVELKSLSLVSSIARDNENYLHVSVHPLVRDLIRLRQSEDRALRNCLIASTALYHCLKRFDIGHIGPLAEDSFRIAVTKRSEYLTHLSVWNRNFICLLAPQEARLDTYCSRSQRRELELCFAKFIGDCGLFRQAQSLCQWLWDHSSVGDDAELKAKSHAGKKLVEIPILLGEYNEAEQKAKEIAADWQELLGINHPIAAKGLTCVAMVANAQRKYVDAEVFCRKHLAAVRKLATPEEAGHNFLLTELIEALRNQPVKQKEDEAKILSRKLLEDNEITPDTQVLPHSLSYRQWTIVIGTQDIRTQAALSSSLLNTVRMVFGTDHYLAVYARLHVAGALLQAGDLEKAEYDIRRCISDIKYDHSGDHHTTLCHEILGVVLYRQHKYAEAEGAFTNLLKMKEKSLEGDRKPDSNLVGSLSDIAKDVPGLHDGRDIPLELAGAPSADCTTTSAGLASLKIWLALSKSFQANPQKQDEAAKILQKVLEPFPTERGDVGPSLHDHGHAVAGNSGTDGAKALHKEGISTSISDPGIMLGSWFVWDLRLELASTYACLQKYDDADKQYREGVQMFSHLKEDIAEDSVIDTILTVRRLSSSGYQPDGANLGRAMEYSEWAKAECLRRFGEANEVTSQCRETVQMLRELHNDLSHKAEGRRTRTLSNSTDGPTSARTHPARALWFPRTRKPNRSRAPLKVTTAGVLAPTSWLTAWTPTQRAYLRPRLNFSQLS